MKVTLHGDDFKVLDDVLSDGELDAIWRLMNALPYRSTSAEDWSPVWTLADGHILRAKQLIMNAEGEPRSNTAVDSLVRTVLEQARTIRNFEALRQLALIPYVWPPGTSISWHSDGGNEARRLGAFTFYVAKSWNAEWGGELLISRERGNQALTPFDNSEISELILTQGVGTWISPKPNRLVFTTRDVLHKVSKTTAAAAPRLTIQGFLFG